MSRRKTWRRWRCSPGPGTCRPACPAAASWTSRSTFRPPDGLTLTRCQGVQRDRVQHRGVRTARSRIGPHAAALRRDRPAAPGYRFYQAGQLAELNRIIALKDLGFTLGQVQAILAEQVSAAELRGMLKLRRAEIHAQIQDETARIARVEARLATIEDEARVPVDGVVIKRLAPV